MRTALAALVSCLLLLQAPATGFAQKGSARAARGVKQKRAESQKQRAKARQLRPRSSRRRATGSKKERARAFRRKERSRKQDRGSKKGRRGKERARSGLRQKLAEAKARLVEAGVDASRADRAAKQVSLGLPSEASPESPNDYLLARPEYVVSYNRSRKVPNWVSWKLSSGDLGDTKRQDDFRRDDRIPEKWKPATEADYRGSGLTRGHLVPSSARTANEKSNGSTFLLSNIVPQTSKSNGGAWRTLESYLRKQVEKHGKDVYLSAGPIFRGKTRTIGENQVAVPSALWKVAVIVPKGTPPEKIGKDARTLSVIIPNDGSTKKSDTFEKFRVKAKQIEKETGLRFFKHLPEEVRSPLRDQLDRKKIPKKELGALELDPLFPADGPGARYAALRFNVSRLAFLEAPPPFPFPLRGEGRVGAESSA